MTNHSDTSFRFEDMQIWKDSIAIAKGLIEVANELEQKKLYRFAEQLRAAALSISNNIAEGSGSYSDKEFSHFLNIARRSIFECVNMVIVLNELNMINEDKLHNFKTELSILSKKISNFRKALNKN